LFTPAKFIMLELAFLDLIVDPEVCIAQNVSFILTSDQRLTADIN